MRKKSTTMMDLTKDQIHFHLEAIDAYVEATNAATGAKVDSNANIECKTIASLRGESHKSEDIQINRALVQEQLVKSFGPDQGRRLAKQYLRDLEDHIIYANDETSLATSYCAAISLFPMLEGGTRAMGGKSYAPKHLSSYVGQLLNTVFMVSSQVAGAVGIPGALIHFDAYARSDFGDDYMETHLEEIRAHLETFLYTINEPAGSRNNQSAFTNISIFDKSYFEALYGNMYYPAIPDIKPDWESYNKLQEYTIDLVREENTKQVLTFPVKTATVLHDGKDPKDPGFVDMIADDLSKGSLMFIYLSTSVDSLSSCCFDGDTLSLSRSSSGVNLMSFKDLHNSTYNDTKRNFKVFHNGSWVSGKPIQVDGGSKDLYKVTLANHKSMIVTHDHTFPTLEGGDLTPLDLNEHNHVLFNTSSLSPIPEKDLCLTYEKGYTIGAFIGDGSFGTRYGQVDGTDAIYDTNFSLNESCFTEIAETVTSANKQLNHDGEVRLSAIYNNVYPARISSRPLVEFIRQWTRGTKAQEKEINMDCLEQSIEFRQGILDGWYATDGGNSNRCYTTSERLVDQMECLMTSLGLVSIVDKSDRTNEDVVIRGETFKRNHPLYCVRWYNPGNKRSMKDVYKVHNNSIYFRVFSVEKLNRRDDKVYCFEMDNQEEPYFTLPNGVITHNCRLKNKLTEDGEEIKEFSHSLGAGGVSTGSLNVITLNINRIVQEGKNLKSIVDRVHKYQVAHRHIFERFRDKGMYPFYDAGFVHMDKQFLTIGINGLVEAAESQGITIEPGGEYQRFVNKILTTLSDANKEAKEEYGYKFNIEQIPAESLAKKNATWDKEDGLRVPRDSYNSYMFPVEDPKISIVDKFKFHGREFVRNFDGGQALHLNLDETPTKEGYKALINLAIREGCEYFTTNVIRTCCEECGHVEFSKTDTCEKCESEDVSHATRVIGYLKKIPSFSAPRQEEAGLRYYNDTDDIDEIEQEGEE